MELGTKLKEARTSAGFTQEEAAALLGVSRQSISNWENDKTYPDIVSVIKMSDFYNVSLDRLLKENKEEETMRDYMDFLEESTNTVKSKTRLSKIILITSYLGIYAFSLIMFWFVIDEKDGIGYSFMFLWILIPVTTLVISLLIGVHDFWGRKKWIAAIIFGIMYMLSEHATFSAANMAAFSHFNMPVWNMIPAGAVISLIGLGIGSLIRFRRASRNRA